MQPLPPHRTARARRNLARRTTSTISSSPINVVNGDIFNNSTSTSSSDNNTPTKSTRGPSRRSRHASTYDALQTTPRRLEHLQPATTELEHPLRILQEPLHHHPMQLDRLRDRTIVLPTTKFPHHLSNIHTSSQALKECLGRSDDAIALAADICAYGRPPKASSITQRGERALERSTAGNTGIRRTGDS